MSLSYNIYCDESCHLEKDRSPVMVLGAVVCPIEKISEVNRRIREIKQRNNLSEWQEIKWTKVSPSKIRLYEDIVDYFFDDDDLKFRGVICEKTDLNHHRHNQTHDDWYYKMYYQLLYRLINNENSYNIYIDVKDTCSSMKQQKLHDVLCNEQHDFSRNLIKKIQAVRSHEIQSMQLVDILIGAVCYKNRGLTQSTAKSGLIQRIQTRATLHSLTKTNYSTKFNLFRWQGRV